MFLDLHPVLPCWLSDGEVLLIGYKYLVVYASTMMHLYITIIRISWSLVVIHDGILKGLFGLVLI